MIWGYGSNPSPELPFRNNGFIKVDLGMESGILDLGPWDFGFWTLDFEVIFGGFPGKSRGEDLDPRVQNRPDRQETQRRIGPKSDARSDLFSPTCIFDDFDPNPGILDFRISRISWILGILDPNLDSRIPIRRGFSTILSRGFGFWDFRSREFWFPDPEFWIWDPHILLSKWRF